MERAPGPFVLLDNESFAKLSIAEKAKYIQQATEALKSGKGMVTSNVKDVSRTPDYLKDHVNKPSWF
jgi:hypothetical protein